MKKIFIATILLSSWLFATAQHNVVVTSPNERINTTLYVAEGMPYLRLLLDGQEVVEKVGLGLTVNSTEFNRSLHISGVSQTETIQENYATPHGKQSTCSNAANVITVSLENDKGEEFAVEMRAYNDGFCFRYIIENSEGTQLTFKQEHTSYTLPTESRRWLQSFVTSYEGDFPLQEGAAKQGAWNYPLLVESGSHFLLITEANAHREYCTTHVTNETEKDTYQVAYPFSWEGNHQGNVDPVSNATTWKSPWRVLIMGDLKDIVESTLVDDVSVPCSIADTDWVKPGRAAWVYWAYNHGTKDYQICRQYVDLAAEMGWEYVLFDWEWDVMANGGSLEDAAAYAMSKGVKPLIWYNSGGPHNRVRSTPRDRFLTHESRVKELEWLKGLGFVGVKIDFFESDKQSMIQYYLDILEDCAAARMMVNFHGCTLPRGWSRTYPNLMSMEGVYGAEQYNNSTKMTTIASRLNCTLPYTRNVVGPMDYTPVAFTNSQHPHTTTFAHELALSVAFESGIQHWADKPEGFRALPDEPQQHMKDVPTTWDETRFIDGYPGTHFVVARRCGDRWYVAALNGDKAERTITVPLSFLPKGKHLMTCIGDGDDGEKFHITRQSVTSSDEITVKCLAQGGFTLILHQGRKTKKIYSAQK